MTREERESKIADLKKRQGFIYDTDIALLIQLLEQVPKTNVLDKIRAEFISRYPKNYMGEPELGGDACVFSLNKVLDIIDKYRKEG